MASVRFDEEPSLIFLRVEPLRPRRATIFEWWFSLCAASADFPRPSRATRSHRPPRGRWPRTLAALSVPNYRLFLGSQVVATTGLWMQRIAQDWLVLELTGSVTAVGVAVALQFLPVLLFGLVAGSSPTGTPSGGS